MRFASGAVMVEVSKRVRRLRAAIRSRDLRIGASGCAQTPRPTTIDRAAPSAYSLTAGERIRMAQAARRDRAVKDREGR